MDQLSLIMSGLILGMIVLQLYRRTKVLIKAKNTMVEKTSLGISLVRLPSSRCLVHPSRSII